MDKLFIIAIVMITFAIGGLIWSKIANYRLTKKMEEELRMIQYLRKKLDRND